MVPKSTVPGAYFTYATGGGVNMHRTAPTWFLLTDSQIAAYAVATPPQEWVKVLDPDGTLSEHEWHYLLWDWVIRKQLGATNVTNKNAAFADFDFTEMVECGYKIRLIDSRNPQSFSETTVVKKGVPALTPREFAHLAELIREVSFYHIEATVYNAIKGITLFQQPSVGNVACTQFGTLSF